MPNPKKRHTPSRRDMRRAANWKLTAGNYQKCPNCGAPKLPHQVCPNCGFYNNELVLPPKTKKEKKEQQK